MSTSQQQQDELDELLFGTSSPKESSSTPTKQQQPQNQLTTAASTTITPQKPPAPQNAADDDLDFLLGDAPAPKQPPLNNNNNNNSHTPNVTTRSTKIPMVTIIGEENDHITINDNSNANNGKKNNNNKSTDSMNNNNSDKNSNDTEEETKDAKAPTMMPGTLLEETLWVVAHAFSPFALVIVLLIIGYEKTESNGICNTVFKGSCQPLTTSGGSFLTSTVFSQANIDQSLGCSDTSQACITNVPFEELYTDKYYQKCVGYRGVKLVGNDNATTNNIGVNSTFFKQNKYWIVPPLNDVTSPRGADINMTRALDCCPWLPGGAAGASVTQIVLKAFLGASIDISLNALMGISYVSKFINWLVFPLTYLNLKLTAFFLRKKAKKKASSSSAKVLSRKGSLSNMDDTALLAIRPDPVVVGADHINNNSSTTTKNSSSKSSDDSGNVTPATPGRLYNNNNNDFDTTATRMPSTEEVDFDDETDFKVILENYTAKSERENEQMLKDLNLTSWVDEICFPSTLMIIKSISLAIFGVYLAFDETHKSEYDGESTFAKYNAYSANIINGAVFSAWLDIGVQFFAFYCTHTDIFRKSIKIAALAPTLGMSYYVKFMFAPDKDHPAYKFYKYCKVARVGIMCCWVCYIAPYVTHICASFFYYLPMIAVYYMTFVGGGGLICCLIAKIFDIYGDAWKPEMEKQKKMKELVEKQKQQQKGHNNNNDDDTTTNDIILEVDPILVKKSFFWPQIRTFFGIYLLMVMYSILVYYVYSLLCNWAVLLYSDYDRYGGVSNYLLVVWDELAIRQMACQVLKLQYAFERGDGATIADTILGYI